MVGVEVLQRNQILEKLQKQLEAVKAVGDIAIDMLIAKINAGDA